MAQILSGFPQRLRHSERKRARKWFSKNAVAERNKWRNPTTSSLRESLFIQGALYSCGMAQACI